MITFTVTVLQRMIEQSDSYCQRIVQTVEFGVEITCARTVVGRFQRITVIMVTVLQRMIEQMIIIAKKSCEQ